MNSGLSVFERTVQKSTQWIDELAAELGRDRQTAYRALRAVLHALRDRLPPIEAAELGAQMPMLIRGLYYEGWTPHGRPSHVRRADEMLAVIGRELPPESTIADARAALDGVVRLLERHISGGELDDVRHCLPSAVRELWPET